MGSKIPKNVLTLKQFMIRAEVIKLYRDLMRTTKEVGDTTYRAELQSWIRDDFRRNKNLTDEGVIKMMLTHGQRSLHELRGSLRLAK